MIKLICEKYYGARLDFSYSFYIFSASLFPHTSNYQKKLSSAYFLLYSQVRSQFYLLRELIFENTHSLPIHQKAYEKLYQTKPIHKNPLYLKALYLRINDILSSVYPQLLTSYFYKVLLKTPFWFSHTSWCKRYHSFVSFLFAVVIYLKPFNHYIMAIITKSIRGRRYSA